jgi:hypothetical protein
MTRYIITLFAVLAAVLLLTPLATATAADADSHHTPTPLPPTPVPPMPPLPVTPTPMPEPEPTPLADYFIPLVNWNVQEGGLPFRLASVTQDGPALWLPFAAKDVQIIYWFNFEQLADAENRIPKPLEFWPEIVDCELYPGSDPEVEIRLLSCLQPEQVDADGNPIGNGIVYFYWEPVTDRVEWVVISAIRTVQP